MDLNGLAPSCGPVAIVAVDGPSAAGKSTYAARLARVHGAPLLGTDEFPVPWDGPPLAWWPHAAPLLAELAAGRAARFRPYDWRSGTYGAERVIAAGRLLILEGVGAAWRGCPAALRIWVDAPYAVRRRRALDRDGAALLPAWEAWAERERRHFEEDGTRERSGLLVPGVTRSGSRGRPSTAP